MVALVVLVAACGGTSTTTATTTTATSTAATERSLRDVLAAALGDRPGGIVALHRVDGERETAAVGIADGAGRPMTVDTPVRIGSVTKPFVATVVLQLVDEGLVDLDAPLSTYLPDAPVGGEATIRQLLSHRSGVANYTEQPDFLADVTDEPSRTFTPAEILAWVEGVDGPDPGTLFGYSNTNYILLGLLIEELDGRSAGDAIEARIAAPLGLTSTWLVSSSRPEPDALAIGWSSLVAELQGAVGPERHDETSVVSSAWTAGAMVSTVDDLAVFVEALGDGELLSAESFAEMIDLADDGLRYGLGLLLVTFDEGRTGWGHAGSIPGSLSTVGRDPESDETIVVLVTNDAIDVNGVAAGIVLR